MLPIIRVSWKYGLWKIYKEKRKVNNVQLIIRFDRSSV